MQKHIHQLNYIGNTREGQSRICAENPEYAVFVCPCGYIKKVLTTR